MSSLSQRKIRELHSRGEDSRLDYKLQYILRDATTKNELAKDACALANFLYQTSGLGHLVIGTNDNGDPIGVNPAEYSETRIQQIISSRSDPPPLFTVNNVNYLGVNLIIIEFQRNRSGPHQLISNNRPAGFPIRRGSTTDMMTANEVFQAMQTRSRSFVRQRSEYETLSPGIRYRRILEDCRLGLQELGVPESSIVRLNYTGAGSTAFTIHPSRTYLRIIKVINSRRWNIFFSFHSDNANQYDLFGVDGSISGFIDEHSIPKHRSIFIHFVCGTISKSYFTNRESYHSRFVRITIEPRITYFGYGQGITSGTLTWDVYLPKFFVSHIKSKEDMKTRIELILNWLEQHKQMFEDIRNVFAR